MVTGTGRRIVTTVTRTPFAVIVESADPAEVREALARSGVEFTGLPNVGAFAVMGGEDPIRHLCTGVRTFATRRDHVQIAIGIDQILEAGKAAAADKRPNGLFVDQTGHPTTTPRDHPVLVRTETGQPRIDWEPTARPTQAGRLAALNLSVDSGSEYAYKPDDFINHATRRASAYTPVVVAAGNSRRDPRGQETLSAWAESPCVISVGATDRPDGGRVAESSGVGSREGTGSGPTVVAYGQSGLSALPQWRGTSFAAPRVAGACAEVAAFLLNLNHVLNEHLIGTATDGIPLVAIGFVDHGFSGPLASRSLQLPSLPVAGANAVEVTGALELLLDAGRKLAMRSLAELVRSIVIVAARPLPNCRPYEAGAGFVSRDGVRQHLESLTGLDLAEMFTTGPALPAQIEGRLKALKLADQSVLGDAMDVWAASARWWNVDRTSGRQIDLTWSLDSPAASALPI